MTADSIETAMQALIARLFTIFNILTTFITTFRLSQKSSESFYGEEPPIPLQAASNLCVGIVGKPKSVSSFISRWGFYEVHHCFDPQYGDFHLELDPLWKDVDGVVLLQEANGYQRRHWKATGKPFVEEEKTSVLCPVIKVLEMIYERNNEVDLELGYPLRGVPINTPLR
ncbi:uncharacterized protein FFFS_15805 [Fusarium fujikuroi]|nr:uncharacterized protein FFFS_15805 [Fusarium fujikuroi]